MAIPQIPLREQQALEEVGVTAVRRWVAWMATLCFLMTIISVPLIEPFAERLQGSRAAVETVAAPEVGSVWQDFGAEIAAGLDRIGSAGVLVANRALLAAFHEFEERLEEDSSLRRWLLPRVQWRLAATLGLGNEQVYVGRDGWLFFRPDLDHVTGPGFLHPRVLERRRREGDVWLDAPEPDPLPALTDLHRQLAERGIQLIVVPTPVKPTVEPEWLTRRARGVDSPLQNSSYPDFVRQLASAGIHVTDLAPRFVEVQRAGDDDRYLRADTHWTPAAVDQAARVLAERIQAVVALEGADSGLYRRRGVVVEGMGDIAQMLALPTGQTWLEPQRVDVQMVSDRAGKRWRAKRDSQILLLGDSFSNVYSDPTLGWGGGAGLAEQLSFHLQRPLDKLAVNAGGALQARRQLQRALSAGDDRLQGKKVLVYQFATRELSQGDWQVLQLSR
jgi:hypothetical protein